MKTLIKSKIAFLFILIGLSFSCKKNETISADNTYSDSTEVEIDSLDTAIDTATVPTDTSAIKRDSVAKAKK